MLHLVLCPHCYCSLKTNAVWGPNMGCMLWQAEVHQVCYYLSFSFFFLWCVFCCFFGCLVWFDFVVIVVFFGHSGFRKFKVKTGSQTIMPELLYSEVALTTSKLQYP